MAQPAPANVVEAPTRLPVTINGRDYMLDALVVRRPGNDKLPVALITHGSALGDPRALTLERLRGWAHDFAHRGWLAVAVMRRGYGRSDGEVAGGAGTCAAPDVGHYLDAHADDLEAALRGIAKRPDADMGHVLAIGHSAGGSAVIALAARPAAHLSAAVNISGGLSALGLTPFPHDSDCATYESDLVWNFARFGVTARMPTLWLYAENDSFFRPGLVGRMRAAFTASGGKAELVMLPPFRDDGHALFFGAGRQLLLPALDQFLLANNLPTWNAASFDPLLARLSLKDRQGVKAYLREPTEKVLVLSPEGGTYWHYGERSLDDARSKALAYCKEQVKAECSLAADDFSPINQPAQPPEARP